MLVAVRGCRSHPSEAASRGLGPQQNDITMTVAGPHHRSLEISHGKYGGFSLNQGMETREGSSHHHPTRERSGGMHRCHGTGERDTIGRSRPQAQRRSTPEFGELRIPAPLELPAGVTHPGLRDPFRTASVPETACVGCGEDAAVSGPASGRSPPEHSKRFK